MSRLLARLVKEWREAWHVHDYEMFFEDERDPLRPTMRCRCGDVAKSMRDALEKMGMT